MNPWRRAYSHRRKAKWIKDDDYCDEVQVDPMYEKGRRILDVMDLTILDYLIGNQDRHHYEALRFIDDFYCVHFLNLMKYIVKNKYNIDFLVMEIMQHHHRFT